MEFWIVLSFICLAHGKCIINIEYKSLVCEGLDITDNEFVAVIEEHKTVLYVFIKGTNIQNIDSLHYVQDLKMVRIENNFDLKCESVDRLIMRRRVRIVYDSVCVNETKIDMENMVFTTLSYIMDVKYDTTTEDAMKMDKSTHSTASDTTGFESITRGEERSSLNIKKGQDRGHVMCEVVIDLMRSGVCDLELQLNMTSERMEKVLPVANFSDVENVSASEMTDEQYHYDLWISTLSVSVFVLCILILSIIWKILLARRNRYTRAVPTSDMEMGSIEST